MSNNLKIFSGSSNINLALRVCEFFGQELSKMSIRKFKDGEIFVSIEEDVHRSGCVVVQSLCNPVNDNLVELLMICDALKRSNCRKLVAVIPYLGYMRQDRRCNDGEPISSKVIAKILSMSGIDHVITVDLHCAQIEGFFDVPISNLSNFNNFIESIMSIPNFNCEDFVIVSPDIGASKKTREYALKLGCQMAILDKHRERANVSKVMNIIGNVEHKNIIIVDDIIDTAGTICNGIESLVNIGHANDVYIYASHAVCSGQAFERLSSSCITKISFSDSIPIDVSNCTLKNLEIISVCNILCNQIEKVI